MSASDLSPRRKTGLVLEGGSLRGIFTAGVLDRLSEEDIRIDYAAGSSSGACNLLGYLARQPGYIRDCMMQKGGSQSFRGFNQLITTGRIINLDKLFHEYPYKQFPFRFDAFFQSETEYEFVVSNCRTGLPDYLTEKQDPHRLSEIAKASSSLPLFTGITRLDEEYYLDGTLTDPIPVVRAFEKGCTKVIVILTGREGFSPSFPTYQRLLYESFYSKYPALVKAVNTTRDRYLAVTELLREEEQRGRVFLIRPTVPEIKKMENDYDKLLKHYQHGRDRAGELFPALRAFLENPAE